MDNKDFGGVKMVTRDATMAFLNDLDIALLALYCKETGRTVVIEDGKVTDLIIEKGIEE